jgi:hypothetical protein
VRLEELEEAHPEAAVELWAEDEARLGLKPVIRRVWAPVGKRPIAQLKRGYEWTYVYGFVRPESGEVYWLVLPTACFTVVGLVGDSRHARSNRWRPGH